MSRGKAKVATVSDNISVTFEQPIPVKPQPVTCESCAHFHDPEQDQKGFTYGDCRVTPPDCASDYLTRRGIVRRYRLVLTSTPICNSYQRRGGS